MAGLNLRNLLDQIGNKFDIDKQGSIPQRFWSGRGGDILTGIQNAPRNITQNITQNIKTKASERYKQDMDRIKRSNQRFEQGPINQFFKNSKATEYFGAPLEGVAIGLMGDKKRADTLGKIV